MELVKSALLSNESFTSAKHTLSVLNSNRRLDDRAGFFIFGLYFDLEFCFSFLPVLRLKGRHKAHENVIERHQDTLLRCTDINILVIMLLRRFGVTDAEMECTLVTEANAYRKNVIIYDHLAKSSENKFHEFVSVMRYTNQSHVSNLLIGNTKGNLSLAILAVAAFLMRFYLCKFSNVKMCY